MSGMQTTYIYTYINYSTECFITDLHQPPDVYSPGASPGGSFTLLFHCKVLGGPGLARRVSPLRPRLRLDRRLLRSALTLRLLLRRRRRRRDTGLNRNLLADRRLLRTDRLVRPQWPLPHSCDLCRSQTQILLWLVKYALEHYCRTRASAFMFH